MKLLYTLLGIIYLNNKVLLPFGAEFMTKEASCSNSLKRDRIFPTSPLLLVSNNALNKYYK